MALIVLRATRLSGARHRHSSSAVRPRHANGRGVRRGRWLHAAVVALALVATPPLAATDYEKHADGLAVFLGVIPAELLRGRADHTATMHGGLPSGRGSHHVLVSIFDERTGRQIDDATVEARVGVPGLAETVRVLEPMKIGPTTTYGNYFPMGGSGSFIVRVSIRRVGQERATQVRFSYAHPK